MTNRLGDALSPYLRSHADNPVHWFPWGPEAFAEAKRRDVPLLISIGYSTCHWCHVMARESFADPVLAAQINRDFVAVKVDREEHPDVDGAYMAAASAFTQNLGWPLTAFATPSGSTFFAGTYWPPVARQPLPAFGDVLTAVTEAWTQRRAAVEESAAGVAAALREAATAARSDLPTPEHLAAAARAIAQREDRVHGGFGGEPKFPVATTLRFLEDPLVRRLAPDVAEVADRAMVAIHGSDLRDHDGGFFRYATRADWSVPHYERMLTDNALLLELAAHTDARAVAEGIADFLLTVLQRPAGGFGAAQDSESDFDGEHVEGEYYRRALADRAGLEPPAVDAKVITGWNGLAIGALARAGARFAVPGWVDAAKAAARAVLAANRSDGGELVRTSLDGVASSAVATTADLGLFAEGLFSLAVASGDVEWAITARGILDDAVAGRLRADEALTVEQIAPAPDQGDGDLPGGAAAVSMAAVSAWRLGAGGSYRAAAEEIVRTHAENALRQPFGHSALLAVAASLVDAPRQLVVVTADPMSALAHAVRAADGDVVAIVSPEQADAFASAGFELFAGKGAVEDVAYDCRSFVCQLPTADPAAISHQR